MDSAWIGLAGVIAGSLLTGGWSLLSESVKHRRLRKEKIQELLLADRLAAYKELYRLLSEVWKWSVTQMGLEFLRWPKDRRISPRFFELPPSPGMENDRELAKQTDKQLKEIKMFLNTNSLVIAKKVQLAVWEGLSELEYWRVKLRLYFDQELYAKNPDYIKLIERSISNLYDLPTRAIVEDLQLEGFEIASEEEILVAGKRAGERVKSALPD
jgi:hypothetical protein